MGMTLAEFQEKLTGLEDYKGKTNEEMAAQAESLYKTKYESDLAALRESTRKGVFEAQRGAIDAGMQRSSYNQAQQALVNTKGLESQQQLGTEYEANVANALNTLIENEYSKKTSYDQYRNQLLQTLYEYGLNDKTGGGGSSGGGGGGDYSGGGSSAGTGTQAAASATVPVDKANENFLSAPNPEKTADPTTYLPINHMETSPWLEELLKIKDDLTKKSGGTSGSSSVTKKPSSKFSPIAMQ